MGEPKKCGEKFEVSGSGKTKAEAKKKAQANANAACKRLNKKCDTAQDAGPGEYHQTPQEVTYVSMFVCIGV
ncbi:MAG: hypothetical protein ICV60_16715 [Pyrinomonadaceae bacterium]|nr:hypothetical protein [Pyrinomonadaceae bacterium]